MQINKFHYKLLNEPKKIYIEIPALKIREKLNKEFKSPKVSEEGIGIFGKYTKLDNMYKIKYIYGISKQNQPLNYDRFHYLLDIGKDSKGSYIEYALVYDKLYDPLIRLVYILAVFAVLGYLYYVYSNNGMSGASAGVLSSLLSATIILVFKKHKENKDEAQKAENFITEVLKSIR